MSYLTDSRFSEIRLQMLVSDIHLVVVEITGQKLCDYHKMLSTVEEVKHL